MAFEAHLRLFVDNKLFLIKNPTKIKRIHTKLQLNKLLSVTTVTMYEEILF